MLTLVDGTEANKDTALFADIGLDISKLCEITNNSIFRLKINKLDIRQLKANMALGSNDKAHLDVEITFQTSYVNEAGVLFENVELRKFFQFLRGIPAGDDAAAKQA